MMKLVFLVMLWSSEAFVSSILSSRLRIIPFLAQQNGRFVGLARRCTGSAPLEQSMDIREEISIIVDQVLDYSRKFKGLHGFDPKVLLEHAHIITQGNEYENVIQSKLESARGTDEISELNSADKLLKSFVQSERKQRARLKVNYILAGAESGRIDEAIQLLSDSEEIDDELLLYIDNLIKKELLRTAGPSLLLDDKETNLLDAERKLTGAPKETLSVLRMVQKLLKAELRTENSAQVRLLARLVNEPSPEERYSLLKNRLDRVELLDSFQAFVEDGITHLSLPRTTANEDSAAGSQADQEHGSGDTESDATPALPAAVVEKMKDILYDVERLKEKLKTGLKDSGTYSTVTEDYIDTD